MKRTRVYVGTSGWHYNDWIGTFYPSDITGYEELAYISKIFNTVENNSSFYRIAGESTYKTWYRKTPDEYKFSIKLNKLITHFHKLNLDDVVIEKSCHILKTTQVLKQKLGAIVIQLPASFRFDLEKLGKFLEFFTTEARKLEYAPDIAIEFRNSYWFNKGTYDLLKKYNVALVAAQSSRYPGVREVTADFAYIRFHGPKKLFASKYSDDEMKEWAAYIRSISRKVKRVYAYFNNDFHQYSIQNGTKLAELLKVPKLKTLRKD